MVVESVAAEGMSMATILLADDNPDLRSLYAPLLRSQGHVVHEVENGREAIVEAQKLRPDLLLLDIWMPGLNGFDVLDALRGDPATTLTRVAMLSVLADADSQLESFGAGAVEYLVKGLPLAEFVERVELLLAHRPVEVIRGSCDD